jgi:predicted acylesterase/phospholipase RssA
MMEPQRTALNLAGESPPRKPKEAVILSGGGANGAYEVGILKALFSGKIKSIAPPDPLFFFGTSIGSYNASFLVSQWDEFGVSAIGNLERTWIEVLSGDAGHNGLYRFRGDPAYFFNPASYLPNPLGPLRAITEDAASLTWQGIQRAVYLATGRGETLRERLANLFDFTAFITVDPWGQTIRDTINFAAIRRCDTRRLRIFAVNWNTGDLRIFRNHDMTENLGPLAVLASSAIPGVLPPVNVGAEPYVDGGVLMNTPLRPALDEGVDVIHVVYLDPDIASIPNSVLNSTLAANYRLQTISWASLVNREIARARRINRGLEIFGRLQRGESLGQPELERLASGAVMVLGGRHLQMYRPVTIHRYHPGEELSGGALGLLNFDRDHIGNLIDIGFTDATLHDCRKECCVIPGQDYPECADDERS